MSTAAEYMSSPIVTVSDGARATDAEAALERHHITALGVTDASGELVGVVSWTDLLAAGEGEPGQTFTIPDVAVHEIMSTDPLTVDGGTPLHEVASTLLERGFHRVFVTDGGDAVGVLSTRDVMRAVVDRKVEGDMLAIATTAVATISFDDSITVAVETLETSNVHGLIVVDEGRPVGSFSQADALLARAHDPRTLVGDVMDVRVLAVRPGTPLYRAARRALAMQVRRLVLTDDDGGIVGVVGSLDFCRVLVE